MNPSRNRRGFALPLAIMIIAILTAAIAAGFAATATESVVNNAQRAQERAYQIAEAGLQQFVVRRAEAGFSTHLITDPSLITTDSEYTRVQLPGGYADVVAIQVRKQFSAPKPALYFIRARGVDTAARLGGAGNATYAERTVGVYAKWNTATLNVLAALTTFHGVTEVGAASNIFRTKNPGCTSSDTSLTSDIATVWAVGNVTQGGTTVDSSSYLVLDALRDSAAIDWDAIKNGNSVVADVTIPPNPWPSAAVLATWPIIRIKQALYSVPSSGSGIIIADSNLILPRPYDWNGIIMTGGIAIFRGGSGTNVSYTYGAVVSGLNHLLPGASPPGAITVDNDTVGASHTVRYDPCNVARAGLRFHGYSVMSNSWMDNVATW
jgi:Tfp pilus assembly protein PilX